MLTYFLATTQALTNETCMLCHYHLRWRLRYMTDTQLGQYYDTGLCHKCYLLEHEPSEPEETTPMYTILIICCVCHKQLGTKPTTRADQHMEESHTYCKPCGDKVMAEIEAM